MNVKNLGYMACYEVVKTREMLCVCVCVCLNRIWIDAVGRKIFENLEF